MSVIADFLGVTFNLPVHLLNHFVDLGVGKELAHVPYLTAEVGETSVDIFECTTKTQRHEEITKPTHPKTQRRRGVYPPPHKYGREAEPTCPWHVGR